MQPSSLVLSLNVECIYSCKSKCLSGREHHMTSISFKLQLYESAYCFIVGLIIDRIDYLWFDELVAVFQIILCEFTT